MREEILTQRVLIADEGHFLTNGETSGEVTTMPIDADKSVWREITEEEKIAIDKAQNEITDVEAEEKQKEIEKEMELYV